MPAFGIAGTSDLGNKDILLPGRVTDGTRSKKSVIVIGLVSRRVIAGGAGRNF